MSDRTKDNERKRRAADEVARRMMCAGWIKGERVVILFPHGIGEPTIVAQSNPKGAA